MMRQFSRIAPLGVLLGLLFVTAGPALAFAPEGELMKIKGYSPETIETADIQRSRQEWRQPSAPKQTPSERFFHNIYYGDWMGDVDAFGSRILRD